MNSKNEMEEEFPLGFEDKPKLVQNERPNLPHEETTLNQESNLTSQKIIISTNHDQINERSNSCNFFYALLISPAIGRNRESDSTERTEFNRRFIDINREMFHRLLNFLKIQGTQAFDELIIHVNDSSQNGPNMDGDSKNVTRILGHFIVRFIKKKTKNSVLPQNIMDILTKPCKKLKRLEKQNEEYSEWRRKLTYMKFFKWMEEFNLKHKLTSLRAFQLLFTLGLVDEPSFKSRHFNVVLKRITKHVLLNEFTRHLFENSINPRNKQTSEKAVLYISKIPKFLQAIKQPLVLNNLANY